MAQHQTHCTSWTFATVNHRTSHVHSRHQLPHTYVHKKQKSRIQFNSWFLFMKVHSFKMYTLHKRQITVLCDVRVVVEQFSASDSSSGRLLSLQSVGSNPGHDTWALVTVDNKTSFLSGNSHLLSLCSSFSNWIMHKPGLDHARLLTVQAD